MIMCFFFLVKFSVLLYIIQLDNNKSQHGKDDFYSDYFFFHYVVQFDFFCFFGRVYFFSCDKFLNNIIKEMDEGKKCIIIRPTRLFVFLMIVKFIVSFWFLFFVLIFHSSGVVISQCTYHTAVMGTYFFGQKKSCQKMPSYHLGEFFKECQFF